MCDMLDKDLAEVGSDYEAHSTVSEKPATDTVHQLPYVAPVGNAGSVQDDHGSQHEPTMEKEGLSFFQRHFTKPFHGDVADADKRKQRRFALLSRGSIIAGSLMLLVLVGVAAAAAVVTIKRPRTTTTLQPSSPIRAAILDNFPDPTIWYNDGVYYAFATNNAAGILSQPRNSTMGDFGASNVQMATSNDFKVWTLLNSSHDPLPVVGSWAPLGLTALAPQIPRANVWAPGLIQRKTDDKFVLYYSAIRDGIVCSTPHHPPPHCIGAAVSRGSSPAGPYEPIDNTLACPIDQGGAIDAAGFEDADGTLFVAYKVDGNNIGHGGSCGNMKQPIVPTPIMLQRMKPDGVTADGDPVQIMDRTKSDGPLVEAPALVRSPEGIYFLFFSSGCTRAPSYDVKYATAANVLGPYTRAQRPLLKTGDYGLLAPGSVGIHDDGKGGYNMAFHARVNATQGRIRAMFTTKLKFDGDIVKIVADSGNPA